MLIGAGVKDSFLTDAEVRSLVGAAAQSMRIANKKILVIIPDNTRSMPTPLMITLFNEFLVPQAAQLDYLVALGTHQPLDDARLSKLLGREVLNGRVGQSRVFNHDWTNPAAFVHVGAIPADEIRQLTSGLMAQDVPVQLNRLVLAYDQLLICGPVFPHEVVGFSGGNKYLFPGIAGPEIINFTHWLGASLTSYQVIGAGYTPVRAVIDRAAAFVDRPIACFSLVVCHAGLAGLYFGSPEEAWQAAAALSAQVHIVYVDRPFQRVLSVMPEMYDDLWTAAKGMYKLEPAVADGGEIIIYAPHISEVSYTHGRLIDEIGYHCRDYFLAQWDRFGGYAGGVLAHSTHLKGMGAYDPASGVETPRIRVTLASRIPADRCQRINLGYCDPASIDFSEWRGREAEGILLVERAGEMLYRVRPGKNP